MSCPSCGGELSARAEGLFEDIALEVCAGCGGAFFPAGSLDALDDNVAIDVETLEREIVTKQTDRGCPVCVREGGYRGAGAVPFERVRLAGGRETLDLHRCPQCRGFWLEAGELERVRELILALSAQTNSELNQRARRRSEQEKKQKPP